MVIVKLLSEPPPATSYSFEYFVSSIERTADDLRGVGSLDANHVRLGWIRLVDLRKGQLGRLQVLLDARHRVVGLGVHRL